MGRVHGEESAAPELYIAEGAFGQSLGSTSRYLPRKTASPTFVATQMSMMPSVFT
jgi:hypothetical protein